MEPIPDGGLDIAVIDTAPGLAPVTTVGIAPPADDGVAHVVVAGGVTEHPLPPATAQELGRALLVAAELALQAGPR